MPRLPSVSKFLKSSSSITDALTEGRRVPDTVVRRGGLTEAFLSNVTKDGKLINPRDEAGIVQNYMGNLDHESAILAELDERVRKGELPKETLSGVKRGFSDASRTREAAEQIAGLIDAQYPQRYTGVEHRRHTPSPSSLFNTRDLDEIPENMPRGYEVQILPVPNTFDIGDFASRTNRERIRGMRDAAGKGSVAWYNTSPLYSLFKAEMGDVEGTKSFMDSMGLTAVSSPESDFPTNMLRGFQLYHYLKSGKPFPTGAQMRDDPGLMGHMYHNNLVLPAAERIRAGQYPEKTSKSPKVGSFFPNLVGNYGPVTVDRHIFNESGQFKTIKKSAYAPETPGSPAVPLFNEDGTPKMFNSVAPLDQFYTPLELALIRMAQQSRLAPAQVQSAIWTGKQGRANARSMEGVTETFERMARRSADVYGEDPVAHLIKIIRGEVAPRKRAEGGLVRADQTSSEPLNYWEEQKPPVPSWKAPWERASTPAGALGQFLKQMVSQRRSPQPPVRDKYPVMSAPRM